MLVLDTSVIVAFYVPEAVSPRVQRLFSSSTELAISSLAEVEFASAIAKLVRMNTISQSDGQRVLNEFHNHLRDNLYAHKPITQEVFNQAGQWLASFQTPLRTLDALQLAVAQVNDLPFVTNDKVLINAAGKLGVMIKKL